MIDTYKFTYGHSKETKTTFFNELDDVMIKKKFHLYSKIKFKDKNIKKRIVEPLLLATFNGPSYYSFAQGILCEHFSEELSNIHLMSEKTFETFFNLYTGEFDILSKNDTFTFTSKRDEFWFRRHMCDHLEYK